MKIVIKVGTQSILSDDGTPLESVILSLVEQIAELKKEGHHVVLVSSGAVGAGRKVVRQWFDFEYGHSVGEKQVLASLGQYELLHLYARMFKNYGVLVSQLLLSKYDFQTKKHCLNIKRLLNEILKRHDVIPIVNENDSVAIEELMFTDNDELAGLMVSQIGADKLIILSVVEGVYARSLEGGRESKLISEIDPKKFWPEVLEIKSPHGRGGMMSKMNVARKMSNLGVTTHIASMKKPFVLRGILNGENLGTVILPSGKIPIT